MKWFNVSLILCLAMLASSCNHRVYNANLLHGYYDVRMNTCDELDIKGKVRIFTSESEVDGDYEVISYNTYKPLIFYNLSLSKKFYEKAVKKTYELGGNGVIITSAGFYTSISLCDWDSDNTESAKQVNAILNTALMDKFNIGEVAKLTPHEIKRCVTDLKNEIRFNVQTMKTSEEAIVVGRKIQTLIDWNYSQAKIDGRLAKELEGYAELHKKIYKIIVKKASKAGEYKTVEFEVNTNKPADVILNTKLMDKFNSGEVAKLTPREIKRCVTDLTYEIKSNVQTMKTSEEAIVVGRKIQTLIDWNYSQAKIDGRLAKELEGYAELHKKIYKKIVKKASKAGENKTVEFEVNTNRPIMIKGNTSRPVGIDVDDNVQVESVDRISHDEANQIVVVEYKGVKAIVANVTGNKVILLAMDEKSGTWNDANAYCKTLGKGWKLPSTNELEKIKNILGDYTYWIREERSENTAKCYSSKENSLLVTYKTHIFYYPAIVIIDIAELESLL